MRCHADPDLASFADRVLPHLRCDPVANNLACTIIESRRHGRAPLEADALWLRVVDGDRLATVALQTPPMPLLLTEAPAAAVDALVDHLLTLRPGLAQVSGPEQPSGQFAHRWGAATGTGPTVAMRQRLFRLDAVTAPTGVAGTLRAAADHDRATLIGWYEAFRIEATPEASGSDPAALVDRILARPGALWLWEVNAEPVTMVGVAPQVAGVARIAPVYTPPAHRCHGFATAAVAAVSRWALGQGADACMLYTDLANPTSNRIYQRVGYHPVGDATVWRLT